MERSAITCIRWVPRGRTVAMGSSSLSKHEIAILATEMQQARHASHQPHADTKLLQDVDSLESREASPLHKKDVAMDTCLSDKEGSADDASFSGHQFFGTLEADIPYIVGKNAYLRSDVSEDSEDVAEREAHELRPTDNILLAASADEHIPTIEVYVYDQETNGLFVHHDFMLPNPALTLELIDCYGDRPGNYAVIGYYGLPTIDIWDINDTDQQEPMHTFDLSSPQASNATVLEDDTSSYSADVLCLHRNSVTLGVLASGSADSIIRLWDLVHLRCTASYTFHSDKVQAVRWHPVEAPILLSASYDKTVHITDITHNLCADPESIAWNRHAPSDFWVACEDGTVTGYDMRVLSSDQHARPSWVLQAHDKACTGITDTIVPGMMVSCSLDGFAKLWKTSDTQEPYLVYERHLKAGPLFSVTASNDESTLLSFGGNVVVVWNVADTSVVNHNFGLLS